MAMTSLPVLLCLFLPSTALAQAVCADRDKFLKHLNDGYSEQPVAIGLALNGAVLRVPASA